MRKTLTGLIFGLFCTFALAADEVPPHPYIKLETSAGDVILELDGRQAPLTVGHFLSLVDSGFYDGLIFHRVIAGFMAQGGGYTPSLTRKEDDTTIPNESGNGLTNVRGTIAMARTGDPHSANSQFFINVADNNVRVSTPPRIGSGGAGDTRYSARSYRAWRSSTRSPTRKRVRRASSRGTCP